MKSNLEIIAVERVSDDLKRGIPIVISSDEGDFAVLAAEMVTSESLLYFKSLGDEVALLITGKRMEKLTGENGNDIKAIAADDISVEDIFTICGADFKDKKQKITTSKIKNIYQSALDAVKIAELLPSALICKISKNHENLLKVSDKSISVYKEKVSVGLQKVCSADLMLEGGIQSSIVAFRTLYSSKEHYAIIIGNPGNEPLIRVHSSCYTGDLLASLACDCRDQLHGAIHLMAKDGGIILYMMQEGRGIGLINKLRAYDLKNKGLDTVDANEALGFDDDERLFLPAAEMLKKLGISKVKLLTNNPRKASGLEDSGIKVVKCVPHVVESNEFNEGYLKTKKDRLGHLFE